jgi:hypothetical protein
MGVAKGVRVGKNLVKIHYTEKNVSNSPWKSRIFEKMTHFQNPGDAPELDKAQFTVITLP